MQFLRLRIAMCRFLGRPQQTAEARQKAAAIIADIDDWNKWHAEGRLS